MAEGFLHRARFANPDNHIDFNEAIFQQTLIAIENHVLEINSKLLQEYELWEQNGGNGTRRTSCT